jgi:hypothetical protein
VRRNLSLAWSHNLTGDRFGGGDFAIELFIADTAVLFPISIWLLAYR